MNIYACMFAWVSAIKKAVNLRAGKIWGESQGRHLKGLMEGREGGRLCTSISNTRIFKL